MGYFNVDILLLCDIIELVYCKVHRNRKDDSYEKTIFEKSDFRGMV